MLPRLASTQRQDHHDRDDEHADDDCIAVGPAIDIEVSLEGLNRLAVDPQSVGSDDAVRFSESVRPPLLAGPQSYLPSPAATPIDGSLADRVAARRPISHS
jgi:hypothetical protein